MEQLEFTQKTSQLNKILQELESIGQDALLAKDFGQLKQTLKQKDEDETLRIAVCGQYSAGKSTLVQALTDDQTIKIGQDITTDKVQEYNWNGLKIADTPGICAGRQDHDALSKEYIRKADLLIYMLTIQGFSPVVGDNFKKLVQGEYAAKTMLLMNKRNQESSENEVNWIKDTKEFLGGGDDELAKYYFTIVDIEDYLLGVKENEPELVAASNFETFKEKLNQFIRDRNLLGKVTSRKNCMDGFLDYYIQQFSPENKKDEFSRRLKVAYGTAIRNCEKALREASLRIRSGIKDMKHNLVGLLRDESIKEFKTAADNAELGLEKVLDDQQLAGELDSIVEDLKKEVEDLQGDANNYEAKMAELARKFHGKDGDIGGPIDLGPLKQGMTKLAGTLSTLNKETLVKFVHSLGGKFKPHGATKWTKWLNKAGKWLGPLAVALDIIQLGMDKKHQLEMEDRRKELAQTFNDIENGVVAEFDKIKDDEGFMLSDWKKEVADIEAREQEALNLQLHKKELLRQLQEVKQKLQSI